MALSVSFQTGAFAILLVLVLGLSTLYAVVLPPHLKGFFCGKRYVMPPGPAGRPVVGSLFDWLHAKQDGGMVSWLTAQAQFGEMTTLHMGTKTWVLLNNSRVVNEIIAKRASITHERPYFPIASGLVSRGKRLFLQKTEDWREGRRILHHLMTGPASKLHSQLTELESVKLLERYLDQPETWYAHHYRYAVSVMHKIVTGQLLHKTTEELEDLQRVTSTFLTSINSSIIEFFPQLLWLPEPLQLWRKHWESMGTFHFTVFRHWWESMKPLADPAAAPSFVRDVALRGYTGTNEQARYLTMLIIVAGADNPRMTMNAWVMACLSAPDAMRRARQELELVCGSAPGPLRLPTLDDLPDLPMTAAVVKEVLRWRPTVPLVPQRVLVEDLEFEGYTFPAGTEFLVNSVPVCTRGYGSPAEFRPERWLEQRGEKEKKNGSGKGDVGIDTGEVRGVGDGGGVEQDLWPFAFSGGRRMCVGYKLAQKELFVAFARLLYCFNFSPGGQFDDTKLNAFSPGEPFPVNVTVRSHAYESLIRAEVAKAEV